MTKATNQKKKKQILGNEGRIHKSKISKPSLKHNNDLKTKFTVRCIIDFLIEKYPAYKCFAEKAHQYINLETIVETLNDAKKYTRHICKEMKLSKFKTIIVCEAVTSLLITKGMKN